MRKFKFNTHTNKWQFSNIHTQNRHIINTHTYRWQFSNIHTHNRHIITNGFS